MVHRLVGLPWLDLWLVDITPQVWNSKYFSSFLLAPMFWRLFLSYRFFSPESSPDSNSNHEYNPEITRKYSRNSTVFWFWKGGWEFESQIGELLKNRHRISRKMAIISNCCHSFEISFGIIVPLIIIASISDSISIIRDQSPSTVIPVP